MLEEDDLLVGAVLDEDRHPCGWIVGNEIDGALDCIEIAAAVGGDDDASGVGGRRSRFGGKTPGIVRGEAREDADGDGTHLIDVHDVRVVVAQDVIVG